jgi:SAM-dependent methyltransferase
MGDDGAVADRLQLRQTFDSASSLYDQARPRYPAELFDTLITYAGLGAGDQVLEIGCATGIATRPLAERGLHIVSVELGEHLAAVAADQLAAYRQVEVICADFESWAPIQTFDLVVAATAWHWIDPSVRCQLAWEALRPGGHLAFWNATHVFPDGGDPFFDEIQDVYEQIGQALPADATRHRPGELPDSLEEIERSGLFSNTVAVQFDWEIVYDTDAYVDLLNTFSGHIAMTPSQRETLYRAIHDRIAQRPVPEIARHWGVVLQTAATEQHSKFEVPDAVTDTKLGPETSRVAKNLARKTRSFRDGRSRGRALD